MSDTAPRIKYAACYRGQTGVLHEITGTSTVIREHAHKSVDHLAAEDNSNEYVLGQMPMYPWTEVTS